MKTNILMTAVALSDRDLLARIESLARTEREATAELVGHLAALELRPSLYAAEGHGSLFDYCVHALRLSEDAACTRIKVARVCRRFPVILDLLHSAEISPTAVRMLAPHLTVENHEVILARATSKRLPDIQAVVAALAPRAVVPASVRQPHSNLAPARPPALPRANLGAPSGPEPATESAATDGPGPGAEPASTTDARGPSAAIDSGVSGAVVGIVPGAEDEAKAFELVAAVPSVPRTARPVLEASSPQRYRVQFTIGQETHDAVMRLKALMRRELPDGDLAAIFDQGVRLLLEKVEKAKFGVGAKRRLKAKMSGAGRAYESRIRFKTDRQAGMEE